MDRTRNISKTTILHPTFIVHNCTFVPPPSSWQQCAGATSRPRQGLPDEERRRRGRGSGGRAGAGGLSRRRDCHFAGTQSPSLLKHLLKGEGVQQNDSLADGRLGGLAGAERCAGGAPSVLLPADRPDLPVAAAAGRRDGRDGDLLPDRRSAPPLPCVAVALRPQLPEGIAFPCGPAAAAARAE